MYIPVGHGQKYHIPSWIWLLALFGLVIILVLSFGTDLGRPYYPKPEQQNSFPTSEELAQKGVTNYNNTLITWEWGEHTVNQWHSDSELAETILGTIIRFDTTGNNPLTPIMLGNQAKSMHAIEQLDRLLIDHQHLDPQQMPTRAAIHTVLLEPDYSVQPYIAASLCRPDKKVLVYSALMTITYGEGGNETSVLLRVQSEAPTHFCIHEIQIVN